MNSRTQYTCHNVFQDAMQERRNYPLQTGVSNLQEAQNIYRQCFEGVLRVAAYKRNEIDASRLMQCMPIEIAKWLRDLPTSLAYILGRRVAPAIRALPADGVPQSVVDDLERLVSSKLPGIVAGLEQGRQQLSKPISTEYRRMQAGHPTLSPVIQDAVDLIESLLEVAERHSPYCRLPRVNAEIGSRTGIPPG